MMLSLFVLRKFRFEVRYPLSHGPHLRGYLPGHSFLMVVRQAATATSS